MKLLFMDRSFVIFVVGSFLIHLVCSVTFPPSFIKQPPRNQVYKVKEAMKLECLATGDPEPVYEWYRNGKAFNYASNDKRYTKWPNEGTLVFAIPETDDDGMYQCVAINLYGRAYSVISNVRRAEINNFKSSEVTQVEMSPGQSISLPCTVPNSFPPPIVRWMTKKNNNPFYIKETNRRALDVDGNLHIADILPEDDGVMYYCTAFNAIMRIQKDGEYVMMSVKKITTVNAPVGRMYHTPTTLIGIIGDSLSIKCILSGHPLPRITWVKMVDGAEVNIQSLPNVNVVNTGTQLEISPVSDESKGQYKCSGTNEVSVQAKIIIYNVVVRSKPTFVKFPTNTIVPVNGTVIFECEANGDPVPNIKWTINGDSPGKYLDGVRKRIEGKKIVLTNLQPLDNAVFQCNASNSNGYQFADAYINVMREKPKIMDPPAEHLKIAEGTKRVIIPCHSFSAPKAKISWTKDDRPIRGGRYKMLDSEDLEISRVMTTDSGVYTCTAENIFGKVSATGRLTVRQKTIIKFAPEDTRIYENNEVKFVCTAQTDPLEQDSLVIVWSKDNDPLNYEMNPRMSKLNQDNSLIISGSQPRDTGQYTCNATNGLDYATATASLVVQGVPDLPTRVQVDCITNLLDNFAVLRWDPGSDNYAPIINYIIEYSTQFERSTWYQAELQEGQNTRDATDAKVKMRPYIDYQFRVRAVNRVGTSEPSRNTYEKCSIPPAVPSSNPKELFVYGDRPNNLIIQWTIMTYIEYNGRNLNYKLTVTCIEKCGTIRENSVNTTLIGDARIDRVEFVDFRIGKVVSQISSYSKFRVTIIAKNDQGDSSAPALIAEGYSGESMPEISPPDAPVLSAPTSNSVSVSFMVMNEANLNSIKGYFRGYRVEWCLASYATPELCEDNKRYQDLEFRKPTVPIYFGKKKRRRRSASSVGVPVARLVSEELQHRRRRGVLSVAGRRALIDMEMASSRGSSLTRMRRANVVVPYGQNTSTVLLGLPGSAKIKVWIRIINSQYASAPSPTLMITTLEGVPGPVAEFKLVIGGVNHVQLSWKPPIQLNGVLTGYQIGVRQLRGLDLGYLTPYPIKNEPNMVTDTISGLKPDLTYRIYIYARTSRGNGVDNFIDIRTAPAHKAPSVPTFTVESIGNRTFNISFEPSRTGITGSVFYVQYRLVGRSRWQETKREFFLRYIVIEKVLPDTYYEIRLVATNGAAMTAESLTQVLLSGGAQRPAAMRGASATWFIILFFIVLGIIILIVALFYLRKKKLERIMGKPLLDPPPKDGTTSGIPQSGYPDSNAPGMSTLNSPPYQPQGGDQDYYPEHQPLDEKRGDEPAMEYLPPRSGGAGYYDDEDEPPPARYPGSRPPPRDIYQNMPTAGRRGGSQEHLDTPTSSTII